jgi:hypothetical protein
MAESVRIVKTNVNKKEFDRVVDRSFKTFGVELEEEQALTVDEFFTNYERLYKDIPVDGEVNSHQFLSRESGKLLDVVEDTVNIQPLLDEIDNLREQLLNANERILELTNEQIVD